MISKTQKGASKPPIVYKKNSTLAANVSKLDFKKTTQQKDNKMTTRNTNVTPRQPTNNFLQSFFSKKIIMNLNSYGLTPRQAYWALLSPVTSREAAANLGLGKSTVNYYRNKLRHNNPYNNFTY